MDTAITDGMMVTKEGTHVVEMEKLAKAMSNASEFMDEFNKLSDDVKARVFQDLTQLKHPKFWSDYDVKTFKKPYEVKFDDNVAASQKYRDAKRSVGGKLKFDGAVLNGENYHGGSVSTDVLFGSREKKVLIDPLLFIALNIRILNAKKDMRHANLLESCDDLAEQKGWQFTDRALLSEILVLHLSSVRPVGFVAWRRRSR